MKIIVLGGNGFIGSNLLKKLTESNNKIYSFDFKNPENKDERINYIQGDFTKIEDYADIFEGADVVVHLISTTIPNSSKENVEFDISTNLIPTIRLLNICSEKHVKKIIYASSGGAVYGISKNRHKENDSIKPIYPYGINKYAAECYLEFYRKFYNLDYTVLRMSNPYGKYHTNSKQGLINVMLDKIENKEIIDIFGDGEVIRDYIFIDDVIEAFIKCINYNGEEKCFNICSSKSYTINELIKEISEITNTTPKINYLPRRNFDIPVSKLDNSLAKKCLNWKPEISIREGIKLCWESKQNSTK